MASTELMKAFAVTLSSEPKGMQDRPDQWRSNDSPRSRPPAPSSATNSVVIKARDSQYASGVRTAFLLNTVICPLFILPQGKIVSDLLPGHRSCRKAADPSHHALPPVCIWETRTSSTSFWQWTNDLFSVFDREFWWRAGQIRYFRVPCYLSVLVYAFYSLFFYFGGLFCQIFF